MTDHRSAPDKDKSIRFDEALVLVGPRKFRDGDWIGELDSYDAKLIKKYWLRDGMIEYCPAGKRADLDRALGRQIRIAAQWRTAREWMLLNAPTCTNGLYHEGNFRQALEKLDPSVEVTITARSRKRPSDIHDAARDAMVDAVNRNELTGQQLGAMKLKELERFGASRNTAAKARVAAIKILNALTRVQTS